MRLEIIEGETSNILFSGLGLTNPSLFSIVFQVRISPSHPVLIEKTSGSGVTSTVDAFTVRLETSDTLNKAGQYLAQAYLDNGLDRVSIEQFNFIVKPAIAK